MNVPPRTRMWYKLARKKSQEERTEKSDESSRKCNKNTKARMDEKKVPDAQVRVFEVEEKQNARCDDSDGPERGYPGERARADRRWTCIQAFRAHL